MSRSDCDDCLVLRRYDRGKAPQPQLAGVVGAEADLLAREWRRLRPDCKREDGARIGHADDDQRLIAATDDGANASLGQVTPNMKRAPV